MLIKLPKAKLIVKDIYLRLATGELKVIPFKKWKRFLRKLRCWEI